MSDQTTRTLDETFRERTDALTPADFTPGRIMGTARRHQRRQRTYGALGGVAAAAVVVALALQSGQVTSAPPTPAGTSSSLETALTVDQVARANASHAWALSLPAGPPEHRDLGYELARRGDRVAVTLDRGEALLPQGVRAVSSPTKVADGWLFIGHGYDSTGEKSLDQLGSTLLHVGADLTVRTVLRADVVVSVLPSPDGRRAAVVTGTRNPDGQVEPDTAHFLTLGSAESVQVALPDPEASTAATWDGDRVVFLGDVRRRWGSRIHVYDLAEGRWWVEHVPRLDGADSVSLLAAPGAQGGSTSRSLVVLLGDAQACVHLMDGSTIGEEQLACAPTGTDLYTEVFARVSPAGRFAVVGQGWNGRVNTGPPARVIDLATGRDVVGIPRQALDVGAFFLMWENDHALVGQATRATPVHDSATHFRWDLTTPSGESLGWDPAGGPAPALVNPEVAVLLW
jgi:hypothetical protein